MIYLLKPEFSLCSGINPSLWQISTIFILQSQNTLSFLLGQNRSQHQFPLRVSFVSLSTSAGRTLSRTVECSVFIAFNTQPYMISILFHCDCSLREGKSCRLYLPNIGKLKEKEAPSRYIKVYTSRNLKATKETNHLFYE